MSLVAYLCVLLSYGVLVFGAPNSEAIYFSDIDNIQYFNETSQSTAVIFDGLTVGEAIECNLCDRKIYWIDLPNSIMRGDPSNPTDIETIIVTDLYNPRGLSVDWISNNIYFSHGRTRNHGRIEVAKCDGSMRKVLKHNLMSAGPIVVNPVTGHLYYFDGSISIRRMNLDGDPSSDITVFEDFFFRIDPVIGLAVDQQKNLLYWTINSTFDPNDRAIRCLNMTEFTESSRPVHLNLSSTPYEMTVISTRLYWTVLRRNNLSGAIYAINTDTNVTTRLIQNDTLSPHDLCSFHRHSSAVELLSTGCAVNNGGCEVFCFSVPNVTGGTRVQCGCPTGILLNQDGRTCNKFPENYLLFTQVHNSDANRAVGRTDIRMMSLDFPGVYIDVLVPVHLPPGTEAVFIAYDAVDHRVFWTQLDPPCINSSLLNGTENRTVINSSISHPEDMVVDPVNRNLYWVDSALNRIEVVSLRNHRYRRVLVNTGLLHPQGLALDFLNGYMYWTDLDGATPIHIERARMDGTNRTFLPGVNINLIKLPTNVAIDELTGNAYWSDVYTGDEKIVKYNISTLSEQNIVATGLSDVLGLAVHGDFVYWTDRGNLQQSLARANKNVGNNMQSLISGVGGFHGLVAVNNLTSSGTLPACNGRATLDSSSLCLRNGLSTSMVYCIDNFVQNDDVCEDEPPVLLVATDNRIVPGSFVPDGGNGRFNLRRNSTLNNITGASALDVDEIENMIYWINRREKRIYRRSSDWSIEAPIQIVVGCCLSSPEDLAVDWYGRNLYWTDSALRTIEISKLDGSSRSVFSVTQEPPAHIRLDPINGLLYWSPKLGATIYVMRMDNFDEYNPESSVFWTDASLVNFTVVDIVIDYGTTDPAYMYWAVSSNSESHVYKKALSDPNGGASRISTIQSWIYNIIVVNGSVYYQREIFGVSVINTIDSPANVVNGNGNGNNNFTDIVFMHHSLQPGIHRCLIENGNCGGDSLCLVHDGVTEVCECPALRATKIASSPQSQQHHNCLATDTFLLIATEDSISYLAVPTDVSNATSSLHRLPVGSVGNITAIGYDPANKSVLWLDSVTNKLVSVTTNGTSRWEYSVPTGLNTFSMAYDWFGGQVFVTELSGFQIDLLTINGVELGSLLNYSSNPIDVIKPGELVYDSNTENLYWTVLSPTGDYGVGVQTMNLNSIDSIRTLNIGNRMIKKLTHISNYLFWINRNDDKNYTIERLTLNSSRANPEVVVIAYPANHVSALAATIVSEQVNLFWYNTSDSYIYRYNGTTYGRYRKSPISGNIVGLIGYKKSNVFIDRPCLGNERPCSHLCLYSSSNAGYKCACPPLRTLNEDGMCSSLNCGSLTQPCGGEFEECYPISYQCDGVQHCRNGRDEVNCSCTPSIEFTCYKSINTCVSIQERCDNVTHCPHGEDEQYCCPDSMFGCYVDSWNGMRSYQCLEKRLQCDGVPDCIDGIDESNKICPTTTEPTKAPPSKPLSLLVIIIIIVGIVIILIVLLVAVICSIVKVHKKKQEYIMNRIMVNANNHSMFNCDHGKYSPPIRSESQSDYSETSHGTRTTQLGYVGSNMSPSGHMNSFKYPTAVPPPPSPDAYTDIEDEDDLISSVSQPVSEFPIPVPPCPSINYDNISGNMSFSVSQSHFPGTIQQQHYSANNGLMNSYGRSNGRMNASGMNPLLANQQNGSARYHHNPPHHICKHSTCSNGNRKYQQQRYLPDHHCQTNHYPSNNNTTTTTRQTFHPLKLGERDSVEAESTVLSMTTMNIENHNDVYEEETLPRPPPGRPPSPATLCSEFQHPEEPPLSPDTASTMSGVSDI